MDSPPPDIKVILVEDDAIDQLAFVRCVKQFALPYHYTIAKSLAEAKEILANQAFDIAILDFHLGDGTALELVEQVKAKQLPFIVATGSGDEETAVQMMQQGACDYLIKDPDRYYLTVLPATVEKAIARQQAEDHIRLLTYAMQNVRDGIYITDGNHRLLFVNQSLSQSCHCPIEELIGQSIEALKQPDLLRLIISDNTCLSNVCALDTEVAIVQPDGSSVPMLLSESCVQEGNQQIRIGVLRNIRHIKQVEQDLRTTHEELEHRVEERTTELKASEQRYVTLTAAVPVGIFRTDRLGHCLYVNERWCQITGQSFSEAFGQGWMQALHPDDRGVMATEWHRSTQENRPFQLEYRFQHPDGSMRWVFGQLVAELNTEGQIAGYVGSITDISARKQAEEELRELNQSLEKRVEQRTQELQAQEAQLRDFFDNATDLIQSIAPDGRILFVNRAWKETLGYDDADLNQLSIFQIIHPDELAHCQIAMQSLFSGASCLGIEARFLTKDGIEIVVEGNVNCQLKDGAPIATRGIFRDITQRKQTENALREAQQFSQTVLDTFPLYVFWKNRESVYLGCNQNFARGSGLTTPTEILGKTDYDLPWGVSEADLYRADDRQVMDSGIAKLGIVEPQHQADGSVMWLETNKLPLRDLKGNVIGILGTYQDITDRKVAEAALEASETFNRQLVEEFPIGLASCRLNGQLVYVNSAFANILGRTVEETLSLTYWDITPQKYADQEAHQLKQLQATGRYGPYEKEYLHKDGYLVPVLLTGVIIQQNGESFIWSSVQDIRERKRSELALRASERRYAALTSMAPVGIFRADEQGNCVYVNDCWCEMTGLSPVEASGMGWIRALHPDDRQKYRAEWQRAIETGDPFQLEYRFQHPQGEIVWVFGQAVQEKGIDGGAVGYVATVTDIRDRKRAEQAIRQQAEREKLSREITQRIRQSLDLQTIFETACHEIRQFIQADRVGIFKFYPESNCDDGEFVAESVVEGFSSVLAIRVHDHCFGEKHIPLYVQGKIHTLSDIYDEELLECYISILAKFQVRASLVMPLLNGGTLWGLLCIHQCSGPRQWQEIEINFAQQIANQLAIAIQQASLFEQLQQELTERQQAQKQLTESNHQLAITNEELARATRLKDEFLANMSHELRTPLNAILGMTEGLLEEVFGLVNEGQKKALKTVERSGTHLLELINDILDLAKIEAGQVELDCTLTNISQLCQSSVVFVKQQALKKRLQLQVRIPVDLPDLWIDERRMRQVLINLLNNAVKFTPEGGNIALEVTGEPISECYPSPQICVAVTDTGIGIAPEHLQKLFQPFIQIDSALNRQYAGTGLGLSLVKRIVELHGGSVGVHSEAGVGSRFTVTLPCSNLSMQPSSTHMERIGLNAGSAATNAADSPLILLAEDNQANITTISSYLEAKGYRLLVANNGQEAIALTQSHQPDLILMDIQMPGMDGLEAMQQIRSNPQFSDLPMIALTALAMSGDEERCLTAGANAYFTKPVRLKQLAAAIQQFLRG
jgi:PAS domain S-box-containing protein